jgi:hypothetical protein
MFNSISMTGTGILVALIMWALKFFNIADIDQNSVATFVTNLLQVLSFVWMVWGHIRSRPDLIAGIIRKYPKRS